MAATSLRSLDALESEFKTLRGEYQRLYANYLANLRARDIQLTTVRDRAFQGEGDIDTLVGVTLEQCEDACFADAACGGATFSETGGCAMMRHGDAPLRFAPGKTAVVSELAYDMQQMHSLNRRMMQLGRQMMDVLAVEGGQGIRGFSEEDMDALRQNERDLRTLRQRAEDTADSAAWQQAAFYGWALLALIAAAMLVYTWVAQKTAIFSGTAVLLTLIAVAGLRAS